jgi:hypothetical protein
MSVAIVARDVFPADCRVAVATVEAMVASELFPVVCSDAVDAPVGSGDEENDTSIAGWSDARATDWLLLMVF